MKTYTPISLQMTPLIFIIFIMVYYEYYENYFHNGEASCLVTDGRNFPGNYFWHNSCGREVNILLVCCSIVCVIRYQQLSEWWKCEIIVDMNLFGFFINHFWHTLLFTTYYLKYDRFFSLIINSLPTVRNTTYFSQDSDIFNHA